MDSVLMKSRPAVRRRLHQAVGGEDGQDMVEYSLLLSMIGIAMIAVVVLVGPYIAHTFGYVDNQLGAA